MDQWLPTYLLSKLCMIREESCVLCLPFLFSAGGVGMDL